MSFKQKTWKDRISEHPTRRTLTDVSNNTTKTVDVAREEGTISQKGDAFSAANMNDLESRIADGFSTLSQDSLKMSSSNPSSDSIKFGINASGQYGYIKQGDSKVTPFRNPTGNASPSDVLSGKTFSTASLENATGTMAKQEGYTASKSWVRYNGQTFIRIPKGAYLTAANSGLDFPEITVDDNLYGQGEYDSHYSSGYNKGVTDADGRANSSSANYKAGYNAGISAADGRVNTSSASYSSGYNAGKSATINLTTLGSQNEGTKTITGCIPGHTIIVARPVNDVFFSNTTGLTHIGTGSYGVYFYRANTSTVTVTVGANGSVSINRLD